VQGGEVGCHGGRGNKNRRSGYLEQPPTPSRSVRGRRNPPLPRTPVVCHALVAGSTAYAPPTPGRIGVELFLERGEPGQATAYAGVEFRSPLGPLGWLVDYLFLTGYLRRLLEGRCQAIKREAVAIAQRYTEPAAAPDGGA
jgi:hypothetical protein